MHCSRVLGIPLTTQESTVSLVSPHNFDAMADDGKAGAVSCYGRVCTLVYAV